MKSSSLKDILKSISKWENIQFKFLLLLLLFFVVVFFFDITSNFDRTEGQTKNRPTRLYGSCVLSIFLSIEQTSNCYTSIYIYVHKSSIHWRRADDDDGRRSMCMVGCCRNDVRREREKKMKNERNNNMMMRRRGRERGNRR